MNSSVEVLSQTNSDAALTILQSPFCWIFFVGLLLFVGVKTNKKKKPAASVRGWFWPLQHCTHHSCSICVCLTLKDVVVLKRHRFTLVSVLGSDQIESSFLIAVCLHNISSIDSNLNVFYDYFMIYIFLLVRVPDLRHQVSSAECFSGGFTQLGVPARSGLRYYWSCLVMWWGTSHY